MAKAKAKKTDAVLSSDASRRTEAQNQTTVKLIKISIELSRKVSPEPRTCASRPLSKAFPPQVRKMSSGIFTAV